MNLLINQANAQTMDDYCRTMMYGFSGWGGTVLMIIFWVILILVIISLLRQFKRGSEGERPHELTHERYRDRDYYNSVNILKERFAKGEINKEEYEEKRRILEKEIY